MYGCVGHWAHSQRNGRRVYVFGGYGIAVCIQVTVPVNSSFWDWGVPGGRVSK